MEPILAIFNADVVAKLIKSGRWRTRDAALMEMNTVLLSATVTVEDANQFFVSVCRALAQKCLCDKIAGLAFIRAARRSAICAHFVARKQILMPKVAVVLTSRLFFPSKLCLFCSNV